MKDQTLERAMVAAVIFILLYLIATYVPAISDGIRQSVTPPAAIERITL